MAGYISKESINEIIERSDIVSIVGEYTRLEQRGPNDYWGCCPFHGEKTPSFHVIKDQRYFHCFGCHKGGDVVRFVMEMEKLTYPETLQLLAKKTGVVIRYQDGYKPDKDYQKKTDEINQYIELYERVASMFHFLLTESEIGKGALDYITKRGVSPEIIEKFKLGYAPADRRWLKNFLRQKNFSDDFLANSGLFSKNYPDVAFFSDRLMFPICNRMGQCVAFGGRILHPQGEKDRKYLNSGDLIQYKKRETLFAFNFAKEAIRQNKKVIFCEGYMDTLAYHQSGIEYAVAPLGTALTDEQIKMIRSFVDTVLLSFDSDEAGQNATLRAILMLRKHDLTVKIIRLQGGKDPAEILNNFGKDNLTKQVSNAIMDSDYLLFRLGEKYPVDTPEGKTKAALEFFQYVDALQSDMLKESCLELLSQTFNLNPEAVKRDFFNRTQAQARSNIRQTTNQTVPETQIKLDAELRGLIAVSADLRLFKVMLEKLDVNDFQNPDARVLYNILASCYNDHAITIGEILNRCEDERLVRLLTEAISSGVYQSDKISVIVNDTVNYVIKNKLENQRAKINQRISNYQVVTDDDKKQLQALVAEKMELDKQVQNLGK